MNYIQPYQRVWVCIYWITTCMILRAHPHFHRNKSVKTQSVEGKILVLFLFCIAFFLGPQHVATRLVLRPLYCSDSWTFSMKESLENLQKMQIPGIHPWSFWLRSLRVGSRNTNIFLNWGAVNLQCYINFKYTSKRFSLYIYIHTHIFFQILI